MIVMSAETDGPDTSGDTGSDSLAERLVGLYVAAGGELVGDEQARERMNVCKACPYIGKVAAPGVSGGVTGCTRCGCFLSVKTRTKRYFSPTKLSIIKATCPISKWAVIDKKY